MYKKLLAIAILSAALMGCGKQDIQSYGDPRIEVVDVKGGMERNVLLDGRPYTGLLVERYDNGDLESEITFKKGVANGPAKQYFWNPAGVVRAEVTFKDGKMTGPAKEYDKDYDGEIFLTGEGNLVDEEKDGIWQFYKDGKKHKKIEFKNGEIIRYL